MSFHGAPCWYELTTTDTARSQAFYAGLFGWRFSDSGMPGMRYSLAAAGPAMVAGLFEPDEEMPCFWMIYFAAEDCDASCDSIVAAGGRVWKGPADIPGTGRFAVVADPQGAVFGLLQPLPGQEGGAFDQQKSGHGNWNELSTTDEAAALAFYGGLFGWVETRAMDMPGLGQYHLIARAGQEIGGIMPRMSPEIPPNWLPYFGVDGTNAAIARAQDLGGRVLHGPSEVPGPAYIAVLADPAGTPFAVVGPA